MPFKEEGEPRIVRAQGGPGETSFKIQRANSREPRAVGEQSSHIGGESRENAQEYM